MRLPWSKPKQPELKNDLERRAYNLLIQLKVYTWGESRDEIDNASTDSEFVHAMLKRPRVQVSGNTSLSKEVLSWQHEAVVEHGATSPSEFPSRKASD